jgi:hypothetical protein
MGSFAFGDESSLATHSIAGTFGAAAAAACVAGLDERQMRKRARTFFDVRASVVGH